jgi:hypothetical protein
MKKITALAALLAIPALAAPAGYFQVPGTDTTLKISGQVQLRQSYGINGFAGVDSLSGNNEDAIQHSTWKADWRYYVGFQTVTPSAYGDIVTDIEGRFKHAEGTPQDPEGDVKFNFERGYVKIGGLKVGSDDSIFGYGAWEPNTLWGCYSDENGDWYRVRQVTYMMSPVKGLDLGVSLEAQNTHTYAGSNGSTPNLSAVAAFTQDWGGVTVALNYQQAKQWALNGTTASGSGMSYFLSGGWNITSNDVLSAMYLKAGANYGSGHDGFWQDSASSYSFYKSTAYNLSYTHTWNDQFSSAFTVGQVKWGKDVNAGITDDYKITEFIVNTTWQMTKTVSLGVEYQHASNKASNSKPYTTNGGVSDTVKTDQLRFKLKATLW